jgi:TolB-like protein
MKVHNAGGLVRSNVCARSNHAVLSPGRSSVCGALCMVAIVSVLAGCRASGGVAAAGGTLDAQTAAAIEQERRAGAADRRTIGVPPFQWNGSDPRLTALGFAIADLLVTDLARSSQLQLVERARLGDVLRETDLAAAGRVDSATAPRVGLLLGAQRLILGSLDTLPSGDLRLGVRVADVATGVLQQALDARAPLTDLLAAEKIVAFRLFDALGVTLTPAERAAVESAKPAASLDALTAYGRGVEAELAGDRRRAYDEYQRAGGLSPSFDLAFQRAASLRQIVQGEASATSLLPGVRPINAAVAGTVDRLNRPLDFITSYARPTGGAGDPAFPSTVVTVVVRVRRP